MAEIFNNNQPPKEKPQKIEADFEIDQNIIIKHLEQWKSLPSTLPAEAKPIWDECWRTVNFGVINKGQEYTQAVYSAQTMINGAIESKQVIRELGDKIFTQLEIWVGEAASLANRELEENQEVSFNPTESSELDKLITGDFESEEGTNEEDILEVIKKADEEKKKKGGSGSSTISSGGSLKEIEKERAEFLNKPFEYIPPKEQIKDQLKKRLQQVAEGQDRQIAGRAKEILANLEKSGWLERATDTIIDSLKSRIGEDELTQQIIQEEVKKTVNNLINF